MNQRERIMISVRASELRHALSFQNNIVHDARFTNNHCSLMQCGVFSAMLFALERLQSSQEVTKSKGFLRPFLRCYKLRPVYTPQRPVLKRWCCRFTSAWSSVFICSSEGRKLFVKPCHGGACGKNVFNHYTARRNSVTVADLV